LVYSVALRQTGNPAQAEEITQAVFLILARKAARLRPDTVLAAWLHETARFVSASFLRGEARRRRREQEAYMQSKLQESTAEPVWEQLAPLLDEAIGRLGKADRNAVVLRFFQNKSAREIAAALNVHESAAQKRLNRAVEKLRAYFLKRGVAVSAGALTGALSVNSIQGAPAHLAASVMAASAKGTAVSSSTLTLIKGALKIMAWTKAKTIIVVGASVLLAAGTTTVTIKEIAAHRVDESWRVPNPDHDHAPFLVEILPTKFPDSVDSLNGGSHGDNWIGIGRRVRDIARVAYGWRTGRILFAGTEPTDRYDFISTLPQGSAAALQAELKRKLGFVGHREMRDMDVLVLKVRRSNASGLKPPTDGRSDGCSRGHYYCDNAPLSSDSGYFPGIARFLEEYFETPVIDQTGLTQNYQIDLQWNERWRQDPNHDALKQALLDQLGLELVPGRESIEMLVMERASN
jgi:uncharacterized protein (TIGR03435 family)